MIFYLIIVWYGLYGSVAATNIPFPTMAECLAVERQVKARNWPRRVETNCVGASRR